MKNKFKTFQWNIFTYKLLKNPQPYPTKYDIFRMINVYNIYAQHFLNSSIEFNQFFFKWKEKGMFKLSYHEPS